MPEAVNQFFEVERDWQIAYQYWPSENKKASTIVFLNGLGDTYHAWSPFMEKFKDHHRLQVDLRGQGLSMEHRLKQDAETSFKITVQTQADDLNKLFTHLGIERADIAAYSYGGGVAFDFAARYPQKTRKLAFIVPYIMRLDRSFPLQRLWSWQWQTARHFHLVPTTIASSMEHAYETFLTAYMNQRYEHRMQDASKRKVAIDLTYGIMQFNAFDIVDQLPDKSVFLLTSDCDTLVPRSLYREFWRKLPDSKRGHWTRIEDGEHVLLEQKPAVVEEWLKSLLKD